MKFLSDILAKAGLTVDGVVTLNNTATGQTPDANDNSTKLATTAWVRTFVQPYSLPIASASVLGGIKVGSGLSIDAETGVLSASGGSGGSVSFRTIQEFTAIAGQDTFTISGGYVEGYLEVFLNGVYLSESQYTATDGSTIILDDPAAHNDLVTVFLYSLYYVGQTAASRDSVTLTATAGQTVFTTPYIPGQVDVFYNGSKLVSTEFTAIDGSIITLAQAAVAGDLIEVVTYLATGGVNSNRTLTINGVSYDLSQDRSWTISTGTTLSGTGFVKASGTTITYDNSTYATETYVSTQINNLINGAPGLLDTLDELAAALGDDANFASTVTTALAGKQASLNGTGFVKITGTTISYDNSTYLTTDTASSTYVPYTGATSDLVLGANNFSAKRVSVLKSSDGYGGFTSNYLFLQTGSSTTNVGTDGISLLSKPNTRALVINYDIGGTNYGATLDAALLTAGRTFSFPDASGTIALTSQIPVNPVTGTGSVGQVAYWSSGSAISGENNLFWDASNNRLGINTGSPAQSLDVVGKSRFTDDLILAQTNGRIDYDNGVSTGALRFFSTSGNTERMRITSAGSVGIGTSSPNRRLTIGGTLDAYMSFNASSYRNTTIGSDGNGNFIVFDDTAASYRMVINSSGNVGIGTTSPNEKLTVNGKGYFNPYLAVVIGGSSAPYYGPNIIMAGDIGSTQGAIRMQSSYDGSGHVALVFQRATNSQSYNQDPQLLTFTDTMRIAGTGNLLVNTSTDSGFKLDVNGISRIGNSANSSVEDSLFLHGKGITSGGIPYGDYGSIVLGADASYTTGARRFLITNGYVSNRFAIIQSVDANTTPTLGAGGGINSGVIIFSVSNTGAAEFSVPLLGTSATFSSSVTINGVVGIPNTSYFVSGTQGFRFNNSTDAFNNFIVYDNGNTYTRGSVGIGTTTINERLDVEGNMVLRNSSTYSTSLTRDIIYRSSTASYGIQPIANFTFATVGDAQSEIRFSTRSSPADYAQRMVIDKFGNVGIGTTSPSVTFNVGHPNHGLGIAYLGGSSLPAIAGLFTDSSSGQQGYGSLLIKSRTDYANYSINFYTAATANVIEHRMIIASGGNVGIGTISPQAKLDVTGTTRVRSASSSIFTTSKYYSVSPNSSGDIFFDVNSEFGVGTGGYILVEITLSAYGNAGSGGGVYKYIAGGYSGHTIANTGYHKYEVIANTVNGNVSSISVYNPTWNVYGTTIVNSAAYVIVGVMEIRVTTTY